MDVFNRLNVCQKSLKHKQSDNLQTIELENPFNVVKAVFSLLESMNFSWQGLFFWALISTPAWLTPELTVGLFTTHRADSKPATGCVTNCGKNSSWEAYLNVLYSWPKAPKTWIIAAYPNWKMLHSEYSLNPNIQTDCVHAPYQIGIIVEH